MYLYYQGLEGTLHDTRGWVKRHTDSIYFLIKMKNGTVSVDYLFYLRRGKPIPERVV